MLNLHTSTLERRALKTQLYNYWCTLKNIVLTNSNGKSTYFVYENSDFNIVKLCNRIIYIIHTVGQNLYIPLSVYSITRECHKGFNLKKPRNVNSSIIHFKSLIYILLTIISFRCTITILFWMVKLLEKVKNGS